MSRPQHKLVFFALIVGCALVLANCSIINRRNLNNNYNYNYNLNNNVYNGLLGLSDNCIHVSRACDQSPECCTSQCHSTRGTCCLPSGSVCVGDEPLLCCSDTCNQDGVCV